MAGNPSTVWAQLATPNSPIGSVPFVGIDGASIETDVLNFFYTSEDMATTGSQLAGQLTLSAGLRTGYQTKVSTPGSVTINYVAGRVVIPAGAGSVVVTCNKCFDTTIVLLSPQSNDATLTRLSVVPGNGSFTITGNANATANFTVAFVLHNVVS